MTRNKEIEGSKNWGCIIPDEYAIQCIHEEVQGIYKILKFAYVKSIGDKIGTGYVQKTATAIVPAETQGIIIARCDNFPVPDMYLRNNDTLSYVGILDESEDYISENNKPSFKKVFYYSARAREKQKSDNNAPDWLKKFAVAKKANVVYFEN